MTGEWSLLVSPEDFPEPEIDLSTISTVEKMAILAGGCFWCTEAVFKELDGIISVRSGYTGGSADTANYEMVCSGKTNHAEAIKIIYNQNNITYGKILKIFFSIAHDPTQLDRQGNDGGRQYRSAIFFVDQEQRQGARSYIDQLNRASVFSAQIQTALESHSIFYEAEDYHQDFAAKNPSKPYVFHATKPKLDSLRKSFGQYLTRL